MEQIIAFGGGGLSMNPDDLAMDRYILEQTGKSQPSVCFLPTAEGDSPESIVEFFSAYSQLACRPSYLALFGTIPSDLEAFVLEHDAIYVGGGRTRNMLALWREWGLVEILSKALKKGVVLSGVSAGAVCWFQQTVTMVPGKLGVLECLGFLDGSYCPHYEGPSAQRSAYHQVVEQGDILPGFGVGDGAALHFVDGKLHRVVRSRPESLAYAVEKIAGEVIARPLESTYLKDSGRKSSAFGMGI